MSLLSNTADRALPRIVEAIYDSIADFSLWQDTLDAIRRLVEGQLAMLAVVDTVGNSARFSVSSGDPALLGPLEQNYGSEGPFFAAAPQMDIAVPFTAATIYALQGPDTRQKWPHSRNARAFEVPNRLDGISSGGRGARG